MIKKNDIDNAAKKYCNTKYPYMDNTVYFKHGVKWALSQITEKRVMKVYAAVITPDGEPPVTEVFLSEKEMQNWLRSINQDKYDVWVSEHEIIL